MTLDQLQRAQLFLFAYTEAAGGDLHAMKAVCYVVRNRVRKGWHDGSWIEVIENAADVSGNQAQPQRPILDIYSRTFQQLMQAVDEIYYASSSDDVERVVDEALYFQFADRPLRTWFTENILNHPQEHARRAHIGTMVLFN